MVFDTPLTQRSQDANRSPVPVHELALFTDHFLRYLIIVSTLLPQTGGLTVEQCLRRRPYTSPISTQSLALLPRVIVADLLFTGTAPTKHLATNKTTPHHVITHSSANTALMKIDSNRICGNSRTNTNPNTHTHTSARSNYSDRCSPSFGVLWS